jgi:hypothetical protein
MPYEYPTRGGVLRVLKAGRRGAIEFKGHVRGYWTSPEGAVLAAAHHRTGVLAWDRGQLCVSDDLLRWRPVGDGI